MTPLLYVFVFIAFLITVKFSHLKPPNHYLPLRECDPPNSSKFEFTRGWFEFKWKATCRKCDHTICFHDRRTLACQNPTRLPRFMWL
jgi:hypothetical protein